MNSFVFHRSYYEAISGLSKPDFIEAVIALCEYAFDGNEIDVESDAVHAIFTMAKSRIRYEHGKYIKKIHETSDGNSCTGEYCTFCPETGCDGNGDEWIRLKRQSIQTT
jgi:hypothetical protein